jgi:hypothetical protein
MIGAVWLLSLPLRLLAGLGLRRSVILACLFVLAVTAYGVAEDLGVVDPPAKAAPAPNTPAALVVRVVGSVRVGRGPGGVVAIVTRPARSRARRVWAR